MSKTPEEIEKDLDAVSNIYIRDDKLTWKRKKKKIDKLIEEMKPFEEKIQQIMVERQPIMDKIAEVRAEMVQNCVHPKEHLVHKGDHVECKFCGARILINEKE